MRKSQIETKLDQDSHRAAKRNAIETKMIVESSDSNEDDNDVPGEEKAFGLSEAQSYVNAVEQTR